MTTLWAIWTHRNNIVFNNSKNNTTYVLELTERVIYADQDYKNCTNLFNVSIVARTNPFDAGKK